MDDNGNIIYYIILGAIYLISRLLGKKKKQPARPARKPIRNTGESRREVETVKPPIGEPKEAELTFEDILRELAGGKQPKPEPDPRPAPEPPALDPVPEPEIGIRPAPPIESRPQMGYSVDEIDEIASEFKIPKPIGSDRLTEPDLAAIKRKELTFIRDDKYRIKEKSTIDYLALLKEQNGPAKAFVMGEIFNRKY